MDARWPVEISGIEPIAHLGSGGFGQVWLANQTSLDRQVAVKISHIPFATDDDKRRFDRECRALGQLGGHPHIIEVHTSGESNDLPYLVLQYVDGGTLADHGQSLTEAQLVTVTEQLCRAVSEAHSRGVLHRDLKPENVFLQQDRKVILGDFGIARLGDGNNTAAMGVTGSMAFVAPEVLQGETPSVQADVYGIGITIVSAVLGRSPFLEIGATSIHAIINRVIEATPPDLSQTALSAGFQNLLLRTMHPDPTQRPQTVDALRAELAQLSANGSPPGLLYQPPSAPPPPQALAPTAPMPAPQPGPAAPSLPAMGQPTPFAVTRPNTSPSVSANNNAPNSGRNQTIAMAALGVGSLLVLVMLFSLLSGDDKPESDALKPDSTTSSSITDSTIADGSSSTTQPDAPVEQSTTTAVLPPLALPLNGPTISRLTDIPLDIQGVDPLLGPADNAEFCNDVPDITGMTDTLAGIYPVDATAENSLRQTAQRLHRFSSPEQASNFIATYTVLSCETWESNEISSNGVSKLEAKLFPSPVVYGDETVAVELEIAIPNPGGPKVTLYSRTTLVRSGTDVYKLFYTSLNRSDVDRAVGSLLPNAVDRLGY